MGTALVSFENELEKLGGFLDGVDAEERVLAAVFRGDAGSVPTSARPLRPPDDTARSSGARATSLR